MLGLVIASCVFAVVAFGLCELGGGRTLWNAALALCAGVLWGLLMFWWARWRGLDLKRRA